MAVPQTVRGPVGWLGCRASGSVLSKMKSGNQKWTFLYPTLQKTSKEAVLNIREVLDQRSSWWLPTLKTVKRIAVNPCDESPTQQPCTWDSCRSTAGLIRQLPANASLVIPRLRFHSASGDPQRDTSGSGSAIRGTKRYGATAASLMDRDGSGGGGGTGRHVEKLHF